MKLGNLQLMAGAKISNLRVEELATDPDVGTLVANQKGWIWYNTTEGQHKYFNGTEIKALGGDSGEAPDLSGLVKADGSVAMTAELELSSDDQSAAADTSAVSKKHVETRLATKLSVTDGALLANLSAGGFGISDLAAPVNGTDAARKIDIENALAGMNWKEDVDGVQADATLQPQKVEGKRYVLTDVANLHADFGTIANVVDDVIVQYKTDAFVIVFTPTEDRAEGAIAWNGATDQYVRFDGTAWSTFGGMSSVTNGLGLNLTGNELSVKAGNGVAVTADGVAVKANGSTVNVSADGVKVADGGIGFGQIAAAALGVGLSRNTDNNTIVVDQAALKSAGFLTTDGGEVNALVLTGEIAEVDGAVVSRKFVEDAIAAGAGSVNVAKAYVLDASQDAPATSFTFTHNAGIRFGSTTVYDSTGAVIIPDSITLVDENSLVVTLAEETAIVIVFVTGVNAYTAPAEPEQPAGPTYTLILSDATSLTGQTASRRKYALIHSSANNIKSVSWAFSGTQAVGAFGGNLAVFGSTSSDITGPMTGTITATITLNDNSTVVEEFEVNQPADTSDSGAFGSTFNVGLMGSSSATQSLKKEATTTAFLVTGVANTGFGLCDYNGNMWRPGVVTPGYPSQLLHSGETITNVEWELITLLEAVPLTNWTLTPSTNGFVVNVATTDDAAWFTANNNKNVARLVATATTSEGRKFIGSYTIKAMTSGTTYAWSASVLSSY